MPSKLTGVVVIDPGHGGTHEVGGSSANNAISFSGVPEKVMTLQLAFLVRQALNDAATKGGHNIKVIMTRETDKNLGLAARAQVAKTNKANIFLAIHFNGFNKKSRGTETLVRTKAAGNVNHAADTAFAKRIQSAMFNVIKSHDANAKDRGVKDQILGVLKDKDLGPTPRACLAEIEFIDVKEVDLLLNLGANSAKVRSDIAAAIATAIIDDLKAHST
jgi:N-acetylmuramoyl-L-alanine amidase